jgi:hypothetical protein
MMNLARTFVAGGWISTELPKSKLAAATEPPPPPPPPARAFTLNFVIRTGVA